jgi:hypothetical protein
MNDRVTLVLAAALMSAGCTPTPPPDTAFLLNAYGFGSNQDPQTAAIGVSAWALAEPSRTRNNPVIAARAIAAVDYLAGDLSSNPRWIAMNPLHKQMMLQARVEERQALGIAPQASSQQVVDSLLAFGAAMQLGNGPEAELSLRSPVFTLPPEETFSRLRNLPPLPEANVATQRVNNDLNASYRGGCIPCG